MYPHPEFRLDFRALESSGLFPEARVDGAHGVGDGGLLSVLLPVELGAVPVHVRGVESRGVRA